MNTTIQWLFDFLLNAAWQIALIFAAAWLLARLVRPLGPRSEHAVWTTALFAELILPAAKLHPEELLSQLVALLQPATHADAQVRVMLGPTTTTGELLHLPSFLMRLAVLLYLGATLFFTARLIWGLQKTNSLRKSSLSLQIPADRAAQWTRACTAIRLSEAEISVALSPSLRAPLTIGLFHKWLVLPVSLLNDVSPSEFEAACMHECAHMRRNDFAKNLLYSLAALPIAFHPLAWRTLAGIRESRELICDEMAASALASNTSYARSLLHLAERLIANTSPPPATQGIGIFDANNFERRIMKLTQPTTQVRGIRRFATIALCALAATAVCVSASAWRVEITPQTASDQDAASKDKNVKHVAISSGVAAGNLLSQVRPVYPPEAKKAKVEGTVVLHAIIGDDGTVENLQVVSGPKELQQSSLDSVRQWKYKPFLLNGNPVEVETTINVVYNLGK